MKSGRISSEYNFPDERAN